jgi:cytochrome c
MDGFELNKIIAAVLLSALLIIGINKLGSIVFHVEKPEKSAYEIEGVETAVTSADANAQGEKVVEVVDIKQVLAAGDLAHGENVFKKCSACHIIEKGGKNLIGPALYGVVGRDVAAIGDYAYSDALKTYGKKWSFEELNGFLLKPAAYIKGTKMAFAGLKKEKDRASVILYMNSKSDSPLPLP